MKAVTFLAVLLFPAVCLAESMFPGFEEVPEFETKDETIVWLVDQVSVLRKEFINTLKEGNNHEDVANEALDLLRKARSKNVVLEYENERLTALINQKRINVQKWSGQDADFTTKPFELPLPREGFQVKWRYKPNDQSDRLQIRVYDQRDNSLADTFRVEHESEGSGWINFRGPSYYLKIDAEGLFRVEIVTGR